MKRLNVLAASLIAATLVTLSLVPLTREALRFDMQMAGGRLILGKALLDLGVRQSDLPLGGLGPRISSAPERVHILSKELPVRLASATQLPSRKKWAALQVLVAEHPESAAAHATLARMACKNGGAVGVGHNELQAELSAPSANHYTSNTNPEEAADAGILLRSCEAGERLDPDNAYFPAMAAVAYLSLDQDVQAQQALHRAAGKPRWDEYIAVEARGAIRRAELIYGPQNSLTQSATLACILFPHYAALRGMARVVTAQAMHLEQAGDFKTGLMLRQDVAQLGEKIRDQSSSVIGGLVGIAMTRVAQGRPGGAPALKVEDTASRTQRDTQFLAYLTAHGQQAEGVRWQALNRAGEATVHLVQRGSEVSVFGSTTLFQTQWRLLTNLALLGAITLLSVLGGLALLRPWLGRRLGRGASALAVVAFVAVMAWQLWQGIGNLRDLTAYSGVIQGLSGSDTNAQSSTQLLTRALALEASLGIVALLSPLVLLGVSAVGARRHKEPLGQLLRRNTFPLAALLTLIYAGHLVAFSLRERSIEASLQRVIQHEGRYIAEKLGKPWP